MPTIRQITLYFKEGSSDKVYRAQLNSEDEGYTVTFAYGRRGSAMKDGAKTAVPVTLDKAEKIFDKLVAEKQSKGYTPGKDGTPFQGSSSMEDSGIRCQLLNETSEQDATDKLDDHRYCVQEKLDGERRLIARANGVIRGINRKGLYVVLGDQLEGAANTLPAGDLILDGEQVGDIFYAFDVLMHPRTGDVRSIPYSERLLLLSELLPWQQCSLGVLRPVWTAFAPRDKHALFEDVRAHNGEGVVFKDKFAAYNSGKPASGGAALKFKFTDSCSVLVGKVNEGRRSVAVTAYDGNGCVVDLGNVTIPPNHPVPAVGQVVEVRYLYAYRDGSLYQPVYLGVRTDIDVTDCAVSQLKYKPDAAA